MDIRLLTEDKACNTLTNVQYSLLAAADNKVDRVYIVCNKIHIGKIIAASIRLTGLKMFRRHVAILPFPLTKRFNENIKILLKTVPEALGYFIRTIGRRLEYLQYKRRTGRNEQITFWQFCAKYIPTGELL